MSTTAPVQYSSQFNGHVVALGQEETTAKAAIQRLSADLSDVQLSVRTFVSRHANSSQLIEPNEQTDVKIRQLSTGISGLGALLQSFKEAKDTQNGVIGRIAARWFKEDRETTSSLLRKVDSLGAGLEAEKAQYIRCISNAAYRATYSAMEARLSPPEQPAAAGPQMAARTLPLTDQLEAQ